MNHTTSDVAAAPSRRTLGTVLLAVLLMLLGLAAVTAASADAQSAAATRKVVLRPVTHGGLPAAGYRVVRDHRSPVTCTDRSSVAVDAGIAFCGSSADYTVACFASHAKGRVLCLTDPFTKTLRSIRLSGAFPALRKPTHASPQALVLADGQKYLVRDGGAWDRPKGHSTWVGWYFQRTSFDHSVYGPRHGDGINRTHARWTVTTWVEPATRHTGRVHAVAKAYYVGFAR